MFLSIVRHVRSDEIENEIVFRNCLKYFFLKVVITANPLIFLLHQLGITIFYAENLTSKVFLQFFDMVFLYHVENEISNKTLWQLKMKENFIWKLLQPTASSKSKYKFFEMDSYPIFT